MRRRPAREGGGRCDLEVDVTFEYDTVEECTRCVRTLWGCSSEHALCWRGRYKRRRGEAGAR
jgi:hypothetical protein